MENLAKYNQHLEIESNTKKLFMEMIRGLKSIVGAETLLPEDQETEPDINGIDLFTYVENVIRQAEENPGVLSGIYNVNELKQYLKYIRDYQDMINQVEDLLTAVRQSQQLTKHFTINLARMVKEHLEMVSIEKPFETNCFAMPDFMYTESGNEINDPPSLRII